ncbi:hypothetical protein GGD61_007238 [Bradyrhizobium sp. SBR1B]|nr:hypothetical protein [Bradyrhizobium sp. SBR1B]
MKFAMLLFDRTFDVRGFAGRDYLRRSQIAAGWSLEGAA